MTALFYVSENDLYFLFTRSGNASHILLRLPARNHNLMAAPRTFESEISAHTQNLPLFRATGMLFL